MAPASTDPSTPIPKSKQLEHALRNCSPVMVRYLHVLPCKTAAAMLPCCDCAVCWQTYALRRLARGVGSGRAGSRQGYATALTGLLASMSDISTGLFCAWDACRAASALFLNLMPGLGDGANEHVWYCS